MTGKHPKKKSTINNNGKRFSANGDAFLSQKSKRRRKRNSDSGFGDKDGEIESEVSDEGDDDFFMKDGEEGNKEEENEEDELEKETVEERRRRLAWEIVEKVRKGEQLQKQEEDEEDSDREGQRDSLVAKILQQEQLEDSGRVRRLIASKLQKPEIDEELKVLVKHRQSVTAVAISDDDLRGFSASKDGSICHWDVETGKGEKYLWPNEEFLKSHGVKDPQGRAKKHSKHVLALAISTDGRYLATGGLDRHVHLWDTRTRGYIQAFPGHRGPVSCLAFRQGASELFSGSYDRTIKIWNAEDRSYITTLFGHQSEVLTVDCLRKERALTVGRDRTMHLWKVPEESRLIFRAPASCLECCCFISNDEFLSGSDDGSVELWSVLRKKPVSIIRNAHALLSTKKEVGVSDNRGMANGDAETDGHKVDNPCSTAHSWVSSVAVCRNSDLAASGAGNGCVRLWAIETENRRIRPLFDVPLTGYVNSLAIAKSGKFLLAGVGQEPRLGRWGRIPTARNGVVLQSFNLKS